MMYVSYDVKTSLGIQTIELMHPQIIKSNQSFKLH